MAEGGYDLVIIGAGPGGYEAALEAAGKGMRTALIENRELGGTCLNRGCIPTKTLLHTAFMYQELSQASVIGLVVEKAGVDAQAMQKRKDEVVRQLRSGIEMLMKQNKVAVFYGTGTILDEGHVKVLAASGQPDAPEETVLETNHILIATGSTPSCPPIKGAELPGVLDSDGLLEMQVLPEHLIIIGGGVIGMEFASLYSALGRSVTVLEAMERILPTLDKEIAQNLKMILKKRGVDIHAGASVKEIRRAEDGALICCYEEKGQPKEVQGDTILIATGRKACTSGLITSESSLEVQSLKLERGCIVTDTDYQTSVKGIYAVGDVTGGIQLAHAATAQGRNVVAHMAGEDMSIRTELIPSCVYTSPEIGCVGITAEEAKAAGRDVITKKYIMGMNGRSVLALEERGFIKVVADSQTHHILGAQLMCARATDMVSQFTAAIAKKLTLEDLASLVFPHPTFSEGIGEAVQ